MSPFGINRMPLIAGQHSGTTSVSRIRRFSEGEGTLSPSEPLAIVEAVRSTSASTSSPAVCSAVHRRRSRASVQNIFAPTRSDMPRRPDILERPRERGS